MDDTPALPPELDPAPVPAPGPDTVPAPDLDPVSLPVATEPTGGTSRRRRPLLVALGALAAALLVGVPATVLILMRLAGGPGDVVDRMVPGDTDVYATLYLDPSLSQKLALQGLMQRFPALNTQKQLDSRVDQVMDSALKPEGISFANDVHPWLGTQVAVALRLANGTPTAVIIDSKDDTRAAAALARIRTTSAGRDDTWTNQVHAGVTVSVGTPSGAQGTPIAYAYLDHTAVIGNSYAQVDEVIDTDHGRQPALRTTAAYTSTLQRLPADRLGLVYASGPGVASAVRQAITGAGGIADATVLKAFDDSAAALRSLGLAVSAQSKGLAADLAVVTDTSKLSPAARAALAAPRASNPALDWVPADAAGFLSVAGLHDSFQAALQGEATPLDSSGLDLSGALHALGVDGPQGVLTHLTGDLAVEVRSHAGSAVPGGALLLGVDDAAAVRGFLDRLAGGSSALAATHTETYRGAQITSLAVGVLGDTGIAPAYAVTGGMAIIGSSPAEVRAAIDAHASGARVTTAPGFVAAGGFSPGDPILYLDLDRIRSAVEGVLPADVANTYDTDLKANLAPLHALRITGQGTGAQATARLFVVTG